MTLWRSRAIPFAVIKTIDPGLLYERDTEVEALVSQPVYASRYKEAPPRDAKPDPDYVPQVGEWFWFWQGDEWNLREMRKDGAYYNSDNGAWTRTCYSATAYTGDCLPATAPE